MTTQPEKSLDEKSKGLFAVNRRPTYSARGSQAPPSLPSKQPLKLPTTKNDLAATQELPDPFLPAFSRSFSSNDVWINYRHCRHSNSNRLKILSDAIVIRSPTLIFQFPSSTCTRRRLKGCKWKSMVRLCRTGR